jgi:D-sedoheptulose 7-phosphate isomerase
MGRFETGSNDWVKRGEMKQHIQAALAEAASALASLIGDDARLAVIENAAQALIGTFKAQGRVFACGNGGSMCDAIHFAEELSGRFRKDREALAAAAISDPGHISCVANDYGYDQVFARYIAGHARPGDALLAISTSGTSRNVIQAARTARQREVVVIALTGRSDSALGQLADFDICTPAGPFADRCQELHIKVIHILIELVERSLFPANYTT